MSCSLIQLVNQSTQDVAVNGVINPGSIVRRYGQCFNLAGEAVTCMGTGYFAFDATVTVSPTAIGNVTVQAYDNGNPIPGAIASGYAATAETPVTLPIIATLRKACACAGMSSVTFVLTEGAGSVTNVSIRGEKV